MAGNVPAHDIIEQFRIPTGFMDHTFESRIYECLDLEHISIPIAIMPDQVYVVNITNAWNPSAFTVDLQSIHTDLPGRYSHITIYFNRNAEEDRNLQMMIRVFSTWELHAQP
jgi:hypothetical protein